MRLVCPNCSAQYEVDASMVPDEGRDVQCSNCGTTWFELGEPKAEAEVFEPAPESESESLDAEDETVPEREKSRPRQLSREIFESDDDDDGSWNTGEPESEDDDTDRDAKLSDAVKAIAASSSEDDEIEDGEEVGAPPPAVAAVGTPRRPADAAALDILKEEAEHELSRRRAPASDTLETQTDMGLDEVRGRQTPSRALRARMAHLGEDESQAKSPAKKERAKDDDDYEAPRRDLLPDIDEINSTLKPASRRQEVPPEVVSRRRSGFRAGFLLTILAAIGAIFVYAQAPAIARALPQAEVPLIMFVDGANALRDRIDRLLAN